MWNMSERAVRQFQSTPSARRETARVAHGRSQCADFNPLPPHGGRPSRARGGSLIRQFQSTPSARRETVQLGDACKFSGDFNPLPPHGGRRFAPVISNIASTFQSTPSARRETRQTMCVILSLSISIHSLRTEGDRQAIPSF